MGEDGITVLLVDDHALFRAGLVVLLSKMSDVASTVEVGSGEQALAVLQTKQDIDLMILDYDLPDMTGMDVLIRAKQQIPELPVILLSANVDTNLIQMALAEHASGFISKTSSPEVMISAMKLVLHGGIYIPPEAIAEKSEKTPALPSTAEPQGKSRAKIQLTQRQMDVLQEMKLGFSNKEIARELNMSPSTVKVHVAAILREFDVTSRTQAVFVAKDIGLID